MLNLMLTLYRRHKATCPHREKGRDYKTCSCPLHCDGMVGKTRIRMSMETGNWRTAERKMREIEQSEMFPSDAPPDRKLFSAACDSFAAQISGGESTRYRYEMRLKRLMAFGLEYVDDWTLEQLDNYKRSRSGLNALTWSKELQFLRQFFEFCRTREWLAINPAKLLKMPSRPKPSPREPYTKEEMARIIAACDRIGHTSYERLRSRAVILLARFYGFRVSDAACLSRDQVVNTQIFIRAMKNGAVLWAPLYPEVKAALDRLPSPEGWTGEGECPWYFWSGRGKKHHHVTTVVRTLQSVFKKSEVPNSHCHRFRHTLATELMAKGATIEDVADMLGDDPKTVREYYVKWSVQRQERAANLLQSVHGAGTLMARDVIS